MSTSSTTAMEEDEELPLTVSETLGGTTIAKGVGPEEGAAFVGADFALETDEPEDRRGEGVPHARRRGDDVVGGMESSMRAMNLRIGVLCKYLTRVERGEIDANDAILRSIDGLVSQLPLILASLEGGRASSSSSSSADVDYAGYYGGRTPLCELENECGNTTPPRWPGRCTCTPRSFGMLAKAGRLTPIVGLTTRERLFFISNAPS